MKSLWVLGCLLICSAASVQAGSIEIKSPSSSELEIRWNDVALLRWVYNSNQFKPYIKELRTPSGRNILRDSPADHLHHHGLMFAIKVNGINFWEELADAGVQKPMAIQSLRSTFDSKGRPLASFTQLIHWLPGPDRNRTDASPLLIESRTITCTVDQSDLRLEWQSQFQTGAKPVELTGANYNGLGLRFTEEWDQRAEVLGAPKLRQGGQDVRSARWGAIRLPSPNAAPLTAALSADRSNPGDSRFFSMLVPFAYLSATPGLDQKPLQYPSGERFEFRYLLLVSEKSLTDAELAERLQSRP